MKRHVPAILATMTLAACVVLAFGGCAMKTDLPAHAVDAYISGAQSKMPRPELAAG
jgi:hypothetical protein